MTNITSELHREDIVLKDEIIRDYMSSLEFMSPQERRRIKKELEKQNKEEKERKKHN